MSGIIKGNLFTENPIAVKIIKILSKISRLCGVVRYNERNGTKGISQTKSTLFLSGNSHTFFRVKMTVVGIESEAKIGTR